MGKLTLAITILAVFSLGWLFNTLLTSFVYYDAEKPLSFGFSPFSKSPERLSPSNHIEQDQIHVYDSQIVIDVKDASWASFTDTNSMDPFLDSDSNSIELKPKSAEEVNAGDIISYRSVLTGDLIVHRVIEKGTDDKGTYFIMKGDNNAFRDPERVRFNQIHGVLIGIIY